MDIRLGKIAVDWSLVEIWCCGKFHSSGDISDHTELYHAKNKASSGQIKYSTRRSCIVGSSFRDDMEDTELPKSPGKSSDSFTMKEKEYQDEDIEKIEVQSPKRRYRSERKSKSNAVFGLASTSRADSISLSPNISDLKNFDDTEGEEDTSCDGNALKKQKDEEEQNSGISISEETIISTISEENNAESHKNKVNEEGGRKGFARAGERVCMEAVHNSNKGITEDSILRIRKTRMVKNKNTVKQKRNADFQKNEVKIMGETSPKNQLKINIKKEKQNDTKIDKSMTDIVSDSDNESVTFLQSINTDFSCKMRNCLANFWFKSELDQHMETIHNYSNAKAN